VSNFLKKLEVEITPPSIGIHPPDYTVAGMTELTIIRNPTAMKTSNLVQII
jgi:hypothetical protein